MSSSVNDKSDSEDFDEDDGEESAEGAEDLDVDHLIRNLDRLKRRGAKLSDPAWRRLERYREDKHTEEMLSDFDDYDIDGDIGGYADSRKHNDIDNDADGNSDIDGPDADKDNLGMSPGGRKGKD